MSDKVSMNIIPAIENLKKERLLFHSEADFQFAFAWELQKYYPDAKIRLEYCPADINSSIHIDILVIWENLWYPIELKYKKYETETLIQGETYKLKNQRAQDLGRYDFLKDIQRLEELISKDAKFGYGFAILLTNDQNYWREAVNKNTYDADFRINNGLIKTGQLKWFEARTQNNRQQDILLKGKYPINWLDYSQINNERGGIFKYVIEKIHYNK